MVDTVHFVIENVKQLYPSLYERFHINGEKSKAAIRFIDVEIDNEHSFSDVYKNKTFNLANFYADSGKYLPVALNNRIHIPSWDYNINLRFEFPTISRCDLHIEFSIPKMLYGTNVFQILGYPETSAGHYHKLVSFCKHFFNSFFNEMIFFKHVKITRIDLCFNQSHRSRAEMHGFMHKQIDKMRIECILKGSHFTPYYGRDGEPQSWTVRRDDYMFKAYDKLSEIQIAGHDSSRLAKMHEKELKRGALNGKVSDFYDMQKIHDYAARTLRYEVTFRNAAIHYLTSYNFFATPRVPPEWIRQSMLYKNAKKFDHAHRMTKGELYHNRIKKTQKFKDFIPDHLTVTEIRKAMQVQTFQERFIGHVGGCWLSSLHDTGNHILACQTCDYTLDFAVWNLLHDKFWSLFNNSQVSERSTRAEVYQKVEIYKERLANGYFKKYGAKARSAWNKSKFASGRLIPWIELSFKENILLKAKNEMSLSSFNRLKKDFRDMEIEFYNPDINVPMPIPGFGDYRSSVGWMVNDYF